MAIPIWYRRHSKRCSTWMFQINRNRQKVHQILVLNPKKTKANLMFHVVKNDCLQRQLDQSYVSRNYQPVHMHTIYNQARGLIAFPLFWENLDLFLIITTKSKPNHLIVMHLARNPREASVPSPKNMERVERLLAKVCTNTECYFSAFKIRELKLSWLIQAPSVLFVSLIKLKQKPQEGNCSPSR